MKQQVTIACEILFLDNAQNYSEVAGKIDVMVPELVIAAFSPCAYLKTGSLGKSCGDGKWRIFRFQPLDKLECEQFIK